MSAVKPKKNIYCNCGGKGYFWNQDSKTAVICKCVEKKCVCSNDNNNLYFDDKSQVFKQCFCKQFRTKINKINKIFKTADLPENYRGKFIGDFNMQDKKNIPIQESQELLNVIEDIIINYPDVNKRRGLLLWSQTTGNGKTLSASIIMNTLILDFCATAKFVKLSSDYFGRLKSSYSKETESEIDIIKNLIGYDLLVIDDFGTQRGTDWEIEKLYELIDGRNNYHKTTIITSNNNLENIDKLAETDRILSRLIEMCVIYKVKTPNFRQNFLIKK
ncbi:MAG TPA: ATP-binding protein [bacterium]|nr:ATP-binding protein [bacterium]HPN29679.1 ATP-binding protein [bacterium]